MRVRSRHSELSNQVLGSKCNNGIIIIIIIFVVSGAYGLRSYSRALMAYTRTGTFVAVNMAKIILIPPAALCVTYHCTWFIVFGRYFWGGAISRKTDAFNFESVIPMHDAPSENEMNKMPAMFYSSWFSFFFHKNEFFDAFHCLL